jgi:FAD-dependent oxidoreductase domain-containing protein 1
MAETWDIVIVGGAAMGSSAAWWSSGMAPDARILVLEPDPTYAWSATALSVASVRSQFSKPVNVQISRFGAEFIRDFGARVGAEGGVPSLGLTENGYLFLTGTETGAATMEELAAMQRSFGAGTVVLDRTGLAQRFPWMKLDDVVAGSFGPTDEGWFDNMGLVAGFRRAARARGVTFRAARATGLVADAAGAVTGVTLESGEGLRAGAILLAAGTGVTGLLATLREEWPVEARKRTVFVLDAPEARHADAPLIVDHTGVYMRPEHGTWVAGTVPEVDGPCDMDDFEPDHAQFEDLIWPRLWNRAEGFAATKVLRFWAGHYDFNTLDQNAILGAHPRWKGLFVASGFSGHGLQQAPAVGRAMAELMLTGAYQTLDLSDLGVGRVLEGRAFPETEVV